MRQPLSVQLSDGRVQNSYEIKLNSKVAQPGRVRVTIEGLAGAELDMEGLEAVEIGAEQRLRLRAKVRALPVAGSERRSFEFVITPLSGFGSEPIRRPAAFYTGE